MEGNWIRMLSLWNMLRKEGEMMIGEEDIVEIGIVGLEVEGAILVAEGEGMIETEMTIVAVVLLEEGTMTEMTIDVIEAALAVLLIETEVVVVRLPEVEGDIAMTIEGVKTNLMIAILLVMVDVIVMHVVTGRLDSTQFPLGST